MPELPEVETVRRLLDSTVRGRLIRAARTSRLALHGRPLSGLARALRGRTIRKLERRGKFLLVRLDAGRTLLSHLGMSGRWLFYPDQPERGLEHVHLRLDFADGTKLLYQDPRRFGMLRVVADAKLDEDPSLELLGPDPLASPPTGKGLAQLGRVGRLAVKHFLLDQRRIAGLGNIYASEVLHRAGVDPRRIARSLARPEWDAIAREIRAVLAEAIERSGTTFSMYRTVWGESGGYGDRLRVYDRAGDPCRRCGTAIRRIVQGQRSTFFCPVCQARKGGPKKRVPAAPARPQKPS